MRENRTSGFLEGRALKGVRLLDLLIRDIAAYVTEYGLSHLTTGDIMKMAFDAGYIDESGKYHMGKYDCTKEKIWICIIFGLSCRASE